MVPVWLVNLGTVPYAQALAMQHRVVEARKRGMLDNVLLLLEHPPVFTLGRNAHESNILAAPEVLQAWGIEVFRVERGGDVTYHGPNQLVGYPILDLRQFRQDVGWFVQSLEELLIRAVGDFGIPAKTIEKLVGVWVQTSADTPGHIFLDEKIAQIGARIEAWITYHGFALNVDPNMEHFQLIVPCGISDKPVTSMTRLLGRPVDMTAVRERVAVRFAEVFDAELLEMPPAEFERRLNSLEPVPLEISNPSS